MWRLQTSRIARCLASHPVKAMPHPAKTVCYPAHILMANFKQARCAAMLTTQANALPSGYVHPISEQILQRMGNLGLDWYDPSAVELAKDGCFTLGFQCKGKQGRLATLYDSEHKGHLMELEYDGKIKKYALFVMDQQAWQVKLDLDAILSMVDEAMNDLR